jgi:hypothetical protein
MVGVGMRACVAMVLLVLVQAVHAQAAALTVLSVKSALEGAITEFRKAMNEATNNLQSLGNSLQANAQNVVLDIDRTIGSKITLTFDRLDASELRLMEDAQALTRQVQQATQQVISKAGDEARRTIVEADIAAYNASYSLPCRSAPPRVVASFPAQITVGRSVANVQLRGNFLRQGDIKAVVNGQQARILERLDTALTVEVPRTVLQGVTDDPVSAQVVVQGLERVERSPRLWGLFGCGEKKSIVAESPISLSIIEPPYHFEMVGALHFEHTASREEAEPAQRFSRTGSDRCDDDSRADQQWCVATGTLARASVSGVSANCNSGYEGNVPSGDRCVLVRGKVAGCGANRGPFNAWLGCRGRGWLTYDIQLVRKIDFQDRTAETQIERRAQPGAASFAFNMPAATGLVNPQPRYNVVVELKQGRKLVSSNTVSHANPNANGITSRVNGGVLAIESSLP